MLKTLRNFLVALALFIAPPAVYAQAVNAHFWGDSITYGYDASVPANSYPALTAAHFGYTLVNHAVPGSMALDVAIAANVYVLANTISAADSYLIMDGINDAQHYTTATQQAAYGAAITEIVSQFAYPSRVHCQDAAMVKVGPAWTPTQLPGMPWHGCYDNNVGDTATTTVSGSTIIVGSILHDYLGSLSSYGSHVLGSANVLVDGVLAGSFSSDGWSDDTGATSFGPAAYRFTGFTNTTHTVQIVVTSGFIYFEYVLGSNQPVGPKVFLLTPTRTYQSTDNGTIETILGNMEQTIVNQFVADGRPVYLSPTGPVITSSLVASDLIHPTDAGHAALAAVVEASIQATLGPPPPPPTYVPAYLCTNGAAYFGASDLGCSINLQPL